MARRRLPLKRIREALRLHQDCSMSLRQTAKALAVSRSALSEYLKKCCEHDLTYESIKEMSDESLLKIFSENKQIDPRMLTLQSKFSYFAKELGRVGVTHFLLWEEYIAEHPDGYQYSQFCHHLQLWIDAQELTMRIEHKAGEKLYVDFAGKKLQLANAQTGEITNVEVFVATLGASKLIYAEALLSQKKHDFIAANRNTLEYLGGVPQAIVPDCLKSAVTKGDRYEPDINPEYQDFASHYGTTILPARPYKPQDKSLVEGSVKIIYSRIYAPLRTRVFHTLAELNNAIHEQLELLNNRTMKTYQRSRLELFHELEKDALHDLPVERYTLRSFKRLKVKPNYHVYLSEDRCNYSVPHQYRGKHVELRYTYIVITNVLHCTHVLTCNTALHVHICRQLISFMKSGIMTSFLIRPMSWVCIPIR
jgi:transposase